MIKIGSKIMVDESFIHGQKANRNYKPYSFICRPIRAKECQVDIKKNFKNKTSVTP